MKSAFAREFEREGPPGSRRKRGRERSCNKHPASFFCLLLRNFVLNPLLVNCIRGTDGHLFSFVDVSAGAESAFHLLAHAGRSNLQSLKGHRDIIMARSPTHPQ